MEVWTKSMGKEGGKREEGSSREGERQKRRRGRPI